MRFRWAVVGFAFLTVAASVPGAPAAEGAASATHSNAVSASLSRPHLQPHTSTSASVHLAPHPPPQHHPLPVLRPLPAPHPLPHPAAPPVARGRVFTPQYQAMVRAWHAKGPEPVVDTNGRAKLVLVSINHNERLELEAPTDEGDFSSEQLERVSHMLRWSEQQMHPVDAHLLNLVYDVQKHFKVSEVRFVSGYRYNPRPGSNHGYGRALDFVLPGVSNDDLVKYARTLGFVGVGIYPISGFVHLDVRSRSYFWVDYTGPQQRSRDIAVLANQAAVDDEKAEQTGARPMPPAVIGQDVTKAIEQRVHVRVSTMPTSREGPSEEDDLE